MHSRIEQSTAQLNGIHLAASNGSLRQMYEQNKDNWIKDKNERGTPCRDQAGKSILYHAIKSESLDAVKYAIHIGDTANLYQDVLEAFKGNSSSVMNRLTRRDMWSPMMKKVSEMGGSANSFCRQLLETAIEHKSIIGMKFAIQNLKTPVTFEDVDKAFERFLSTRHHIDSEDESSKAHDASIVFTSTEECTRVHQVFLLLLNAYASQNAGDTFAHKLDMMKVTYQVCITADPKSQEWNAPLKIPTSETHPLMKLDDERDKQKQNYKSFKFLSIAGVAMALVGIGVLIATGGIGVPIMCGAAALLWNVPRICAYIKIALLNRRISNVLRESLAEQRENQLLVSSTTTSVMSALDAAPTNPTNAIRNAVSQEVDNSSAVVTSPPISSPTSVASSSPDSAYSSMPQCYNIPSPLRR